MSEHLGIDRERAARLKAIIDRLGEGVKPSEVKKEFHDLIKGADAMEVAALEQSLIEGGMQVQEVQRLCEVHADVFKDGLEKGEKSHSLPGHPIHSYLAENIEARKLLWPLRLAGFFGDAAAVGKAATALKPIIVHYERKENQLFPYLEKVGFTGPSKVMWGKHDEIRDRFRSLEAAVSAGDSRASRSNARALARQLTSMMFMEEKILFPNAIKRLGERDWVKIRQGDDAIGYAWVKPGAIWDASLAWAQAKDSVKATPVASQAAGPVASQAANLSTPQEASPAASREVPTISDEPMVHLNEGALPNKVLDLMLRNLPLDVSFVDANDRVLYYSDSAHRVFPRSPAIIGREVKNCHPPKSVAVVERILEAFKKKEKESAEFWINMGGRFILISYKAIYDDDGSYLGTMESSWDATDIRALEGERRLLDW
ncbi:MAG: DUF438 domain-containing protein [Clostridia bacterium]